MSEPYLAEIRMTGFQFAPKGWALCNGQILPINQNQALFSILGTTYGGNGQTTFALPDLRGRVPVHMDAGFGLGQQGGAASHTLSASEMPAHTHSLGISTAVSHQADPSGRVLGNVEAGALNYYAPQDSTATLAPSTVGNSGGSQPHENMQPYLAINFIIALQGSFPSQS
ncbi:MULTISPECIES: phage tail protein [unclassified Duganella]|uniref:phage tail protein n=1 Tax=unclassified Duganella TaxID=2636909 RepID=UPI0006FA887E|nr:MULTISPECIES: tail fiber protein [unclassified Duganella]KQV59375.1 phage tail protein [Duganella sp. Root336D2]KRC01471.1 phage tail protein [Duganella sp. Root198D2]